MNQESAPAALVTGGSRGVGAATARALAARGYDVLLTYRNKAARAQRVRAELDRLRVRALALQSDMTQSADLDRLIATLQGWSNHLDILVLNASGGLERDLLATDPDYPARINRDAQLALVDRALPYMHHGATIVFVTSHWAHLYGRVGQLPGYQPVAATKHAGEQALRAQQPELAARGIRLLVVTCDLIEGTITLKLLARAEPRLVEQRFQGAASLPTVAAMAEAIAAAATDPALPSGQTIVVGRSLDSLLGK